MEKPALFNALHSDVFIPDIADSVHVAAAYRHASLIVGIILVMLQHVYIPESHVFYPVSDPVARVAVDSHVHRMGDIGPKYGIFHDNVPRISPVVPSRAVNGYAVIGIPHEYVVYGNIAAAHDIDAVAPALIAERTQIVYGDVPALSAEKSIMAGIHDYDIAHFYVFGISRLDAALRSEQDAAAAYGHVFDRIADESSLEHRSRR